LSLFGVQRERLAGLNRGWGPGEGELLQGAVNGGTGANAFDDLLAEIAAFAEVKGARLGRFLGKVALVDVNAVEWGRRQDTQRLHGGNATGGCSGGEQRRPYFG